MTAITLNHFARFVDAKGATRTSIVKEALRQPPYGVPLDYWYGLRSGITSVIHKAGSKGDLDRVLRDLHDDRKAENYAANIEGFKKFWGRKDLRFDGVPTSQRWSSSGLEVKVAPDMRLFLRDQLYVVKLHFRGGPGDDRLSLTRLETMVCLMKRACPTPEAIFAVVDVRKGELRQRKVSTGFEAALAGEAAAFVSIAREIEAA